MKIKFSSYFKTRSVMLLPYVMIAKWHHKGEIPAISVTFGWLFWDATINFFKNKHIGK